MATIVERREYPPNFSDFIVDLNGSKITVTVTASAAVIDEWIKTTVANGKYFHFLRMLVVGLSMDPHANTLHFCVDRRCLIIRLSQAGYVPVSLRQFLWDRAVKFAGFYNEWNYPTLMFSKHRLVMVTDSVDLTWMKDGIDKLPKEGIISEFLEFKVELREEIRTSDWSQKVLSDEQVLYACIESHGAFTAGLKLQMWNLCF